MPRALSSSWGSPAKNRLERSCSPQSAACAVIRATGRSAWLTSHIDSATIATSISAPSAIDPSSADEALLS